VREQDAGAAHRNFERRKPPRARPAPTCSCWLEPPLVIGLTPAGEAIAYVQHWEGCPLFEASREVER
jgi:hypothetical protein